MHKATPKKTVGRGTSQCGKACSISVCNEAYELGTGCVIHAAAAMAIVGPSCLAFILI